MKIINNIGKFALSLGIASSLIVSCTNYLDVDTDTDNPKIAALGKVLTKTQIDLSLIGDFERFGGSNLGVYTHQFCDRGTSDQYANRPDDGGFSNDWNQTYSVLRNLDFLIEEGTKTNNLVYVGVAQLEKAYIMSVAVDLWGDVPFSEGGKASTGVYNPIFDNQRTIYLAVFDLIEKGKVNVNSNTGVLKPAVLDDLIYKGDKSKWVKFANTLKLKLYNQTRNDASFDNVGFAALIALPATSFMSTNKLDDFQFVQNLKTSSTFADNERNKLYISSYEGTQFGDYISPWFYEILKGVNPLVHTANPDPRMPYMIFNQIKAGDLPSVAAGSNPKADYWDKTSGFFSIRFGSSGPNRDQSAEPSYSYPGIYPCGGRYDDGLGGDAKVKSNSQGVAPRRMLTYDEYLFIRAELIQVGKIPGNAATQLDLAIKENFKKIDDVVAKGKTVSGSTQVVPVLATSAGATAFLTKIGIEFAAATPAKKLEIIMTQKWVATFGDQIDQYTDYRRTGYPVLANPNSSSAEYQLNNLDAFPLSDLLTSYGGTASYPQSLYWPQSELNGNPKAPAQKNNKSYKIFFH